MPVACFTNTSPTFYPARRLISGITNANPAVVTTTLDHEYVTGQIVRIQVPKNWGMERANNLSGLITVTGSKTFSIDINTKNLDPFVTPAASPQVISCAQVLPIGEVGYSFNAATEQVPPYRRV